MLNPFCWLRFQRTRRAIADYPLYDPPNRAAEGSLPFKKIEENFGYFMECRLQRLSFFMRWLSNSFGVEAHLNEDGVLALERWADRYSGGLVTDGYESSKIFTTYQPAWRGDYRGYNALVDVAVFLGEYLISKRPHLHWTLLRDTNGTCVDEKEGPMGATLGRPDLGGYAVVPFAPSLFQLVYLKCIGSRDRKNFGGNRLRKIHVSFAWSCSESLHVAEHRDSRVPFIYGDYGHGPL